MMVVPRLALIYVALFHAKHIKFAFESWVWPVAGFFLMPMTTLAYIWAVVASNKHIDGLYLAIVIMGAILDVGLLTGAGNTKYRSVPEHD